MGIVTSSESLKDDSIITLLHTRGLLIREFGCPSKRTIQLIINKEESRSSFEEGKKDCKVFHYIGDEAVLMAVFLNSDLLRFSEDSKTLTIEVQSVSETGRNLMSTINRFNKSRYGNTTADK